MSKYFKSILRVFLCAVVIAGAFSFLAPKNVQASGFTVAITTYVPTASAGDFVLGAYPDIANGIYLRQLIIANNSATAQTISVWDTCTSSTTATLAFKIDLPATIGTYYVPDGITFLPQIAKLTNPCISRSSTTGITQGTFIYE